MSEWEKWNARLTFCGKLFGMENEKDHRIGGCDGYKAEHWRDLPEKTVDKSVDKSVDFCPPISSSPHPWMNHYMISPMRLYCIMLSCFGAGIIVCGIACFLGGK